MSYENLCMKCMKNIGNEKICPYCNFNNDSPQLPPYAPMGTIVGGRYLLGAVLESNGDGATYMAYDIERKAAVNVREFLPDTLVTRSTSNCDLIVKNGKENTYASCLNGFLDMWRKLARMRGLSALILVIDIIEENNTAYAVCEHMEGAVTLRDYLLSGKTGYISWEEARMMFMPVLSTLSTLHSAGIIHRGISPNTLYVCADHKIRIGGFSIPECRNVNSGIASEIFSGYAPVEQFGVQAPSGPWTDIYSFAAVLYRALIGSTPIDSTVRMNSDRMMIPAKFAEQIPAYVINALIKALQIMPEDRTKTVDQFRSELSASPTVAIAGDYNNNNRRENHSTANRPQPQRPAHVQNQQKPRPSSPPARARKSPKKPSSGIAGLDLKNTDMKTAIISGAIAAGVLLLVFIILCFTVLKPHIGVGKDENTTSPINAEQELVTVPQFTGRTYSSIQSQRSYFSNFDIQKTEEFNSEVKQGYIISQSVDSGAQVPKGTKIEIVVSKGIEQITMINVVGDTYEEASEKLSEIGFKCEKVDRVNTGGNTSGTVAASTLIVGNQYNKGTVVRLQVWVDEETTAAPSTSNTTDSE